MTAAPSRGYYLRLFGIMIWVIIFGLITAIEGITSDQNVNREAGYFFLVLDTVMILGFIGVVLSERNKIKEAFHRAKSAPEIK